MVSNEDGIRVFNDGSITRSMDMKAITTYKKPFGYTRDLLLGIAMEHTEDPHLVIMSITGGVLSVKLNSPTPDRASIKRILVDPLNSGKIVYVDTVGSIEVLQIPKELVDSILQPHQKKRRKWGPVDSVILPMPPRKLIDIQFCQSSLVALFRDQTETVLQTIAPHRGSFSGWKHLIRGSITSFLCFNNYILVVDLDKIRLLSKKNNQWMTYTLPNVLQLHEGELVEHSCNINGHLTLLISNKGMSYLVQHKTEQLEDDAVLPGTIKKLGLVTIPSKILYLGGLTFYVQSNQSYLVIFKINDQKPYVTLIKTFEEAKPIMHINAASTTMTEDIFVCQGGQFNGELIRYPPFKNKFVPEKKSDTDEFSEPETDSNAHDLALAKRYSTCGWRATIPDDIEQLVLNEDTNKHSVLAWDCIRVSSKRWLAARVLLSFAVEIWFLDDKNSKEIVQLDSYIMPSACFLSADINEQHSYYFLILFMDGTFYMVQPFKSPKLTFLTTQAGSALNMMEISWGLYLLYNEFDFWIFKAWKGYVERCSIDDRKRIKSVIKAKGSLVDVSFNKGPIERFQLRMGCQEYSRIFSKSCYLKSILVNDFIIVLSQNVVESAESSFHLLAIDRFTFKVIDSFDFDKEKTPIDILNLNPDTTLRNKISSLPYLLEEVHIANKFIVAFKSLPVALLYSVDSDGIKVERQQGWKYESVKKQHGRQLMVQRFVQVSPKEATFMAVGNLNFVMELKHNEIFYWTYYTNMKCTLPTNVTEASPLNGSLITSDILGHIYRINLPKSISDHDHIELAGNLESMKRTEQSLSYTRLYVSEKDFISTLTTHGTDTIIFGDASGNIHVKIGSNNFSINVCNCLITSVAVLTQHIQDNEDSEGFGILVGSIRGGIYFVFFRKSGVTEDDPEVIPFIRAIG